MKLAFVGVAAAAALIAGCNTMKGVGEDISAGGQKVEDVLKNDKKPERDATGSSGTNASSMPSGQSTSASPSGTSTQ